VVAAAVLLCPATINQEKAGVKSMRAIIEVLKRGHIVCLYPEGARTFDGRIDEIKPGFSLLMRRSGATLIPMVIDGIFERWPRTQKYPKLGGRVGIMYGKPIDAAYIKEVGEEQFIGEFNRTLHQMHNDLRQKMGREPLDYNQ
jgi:1-acyl-sn-glycerol-3-phosphate acyltransferase